MSFNERQREKPLYILCSAIHIYICVCVYVCVCMCVCVCMNLRRSTELKWCSTWRFYDILNK